MTLLLGQHGDSTENDSFLMNDSLEYLDLLHLSIISNGLLTEEERIENLLGVLPYQFEPELDCDCLENHIGGGGGGGV